MPCGAAGQAETAGAARASHWNAILHVAKEVAGEVLEEAVLEPIFGEWFYTAHSMAGKDDRIRGWKL